MLVVVQRPKDLTDREIKLEFLNTPLIYFIRSANTE